MSKERNAIEGIIEDIHGNGKQMRLARRHLEDYERNAPSFEPSRRDFLKAGTACAALLSLPSFLAGCATAVQHDGKTYEGWQAALLKHDLVRGPTLMVSPWTGRPSDFSEHLRRISNNGFGGSDYDVPVGTPVTPICSGVAKEGVDQIGSAGMVLGLRVFVRGQPFYCYYGHLSRVVIAGVVHLGSVVAFSGNTGTSAGGIEMPAHLHLSVFRVDAYGTWEKPGIDPATHGIDRGLPVYWDTLTPLHQYHPANQRYHLEGVLDTLPQELKEETTLDEATKKALLERRRNPQAIAGYHADRVLSKHWRRNGTLGYEFLPGSYLYALTLRVLNAMSQQEIVVMAPFPHPLLADFYRKQNPGAGSDLWPL
jgi:murein DD-endopeptidase MepM/ murein hydrolase activator NlpD